MDIFVQTKSQKIEEEEEEKKSYNIRRNKSLSQEKELSAELIG